MNPELIIELLWKSALVAGATLLLIGAARGRSASEKSLIGEVGMLSLLLLPLASWLLPRLEVTPPAAFGQAIEEFTPAVPAAQSSVPAVAAAGSGFDWLALAGLVYVLPIAFLIASLGYAILRLQVVRRRADVIQETGWLKALAAAQQRIGIKHGTALLTSGEINSPISWGVVRPIIVIDGAARMDIERAEAIIAHELAHVHRLDWLKLIVGRLVTAIFWANPLVWLLSQRCHQLREEAADDAVLRTEVDRTEYASLLVTAVRHANSGPLLAANGVAPSRSSIAKRVAHVLDSSRSRAPARLKMAAVSLALAGAVNGALAAAEPARFSASGIDPTAGERAATELAAIDSPHAQALAAAIRDRNWETRRVAGDTTFYRAEAIRPLILALRDEHPVVRRIAVWGLSEMRPTPDPLATPAVSQLLRDPSPEVRAEAAGAIGEFPSVANSRSIEKLLLGDPSPDVRLRAAHALGDIQDPGSRATLEAAANDPDFRVRLKAAWALRQVQEAERILNR